MTCNELKFAMIVEKSLSTLDHSESRQMCVEVATVLSRLMLLISERYSEHLDSKRNITIDLLGIIKNAERRFLDVTELNLKTACPHTNDYNTSCGAYGICNNFYSLPPSGSAGTTVFITKSLIKILFS